MRFAPMIFAALLPMSAAAHDFKIGDLVVMHPVAFATAKTAMTGAGYLTITNTGETADRLLAVEADFPRVMVHDTKVEDGLATMFHIDALDIAPGETVELAPGGKHVMFMGLNGDPFEVGEEVNATLVFENAGSLEVVFKVEERPEMRVAHGEDSDEAAEDHSGH
jgi:copper(I)-binding protein